MENEASITPICSFIESQIGFFNMLKQFLLFFSFQTLTLAEVCPEVKSTDFHIIWPETSSKATLSIPPCTDFSHYPQFRNCLDGVWDDEPLCLFIQAQKLPLCPNGFIEDADICYQILPKSKYPPNCPFKYVLAFNKVRNLAIKNNITVWIPARRDDSNGLGFYQWEEPTYLYKYEYKFSEFLQLGSTLEEKCLIQNPDGSVKRVKCDEEYESICAYSNLLTTDNRICENEMYSCRRSDLAFRLKCFCEEPDDQNFNPLAEFQSLYQNSVLKILTNQTCYIGLTKNSENRFVWINSLEEISYIYWDSSMLYSDSSSNQVASSVNGWVMIDDDLHCSITQIEVNEENSSLSLKYDENSAELILTVNNSLWLDQAEESGAVFCFTDSIPGQFLRNYETRLTSSNENIILDKAVSSGYYWCEAFNFASLEIIKSEKVFVRRENSSEFVAVLKVPYPANDIFPLSSAMLSYLSDNELNVLDIIKIEKGIDYNIQKILDLDVINSLITINVHFNTDKIDNSQREKEFKFIETTIIKLLEKTNIQMISFRSSDFCVAEITNVHWPNADINHRVISKEFCFDSNGILMERRCGGDFIDGAVWEEVENCTVLSSSLATDYLVELYYNEDFQIYKLQHVFLFPLNLFAALDVFLLEEIIKKHLNSVVIFELIGVICNILEMNSSILREAQIVADVLDKILDTINDAIRTKKLETSECNNFNMAFDQLKNIDGIYITKQADGETTINIFKNYSGIQSVITSDDIEVAVWFSSNLTKNAEDFYQAVVISFFNSAFFQDSNFNQNVSMVFKGFIDIISEETLSGPIKLMQKVNYVNKQNFSCVQWVMNQDSKRGFWQKVNDSTSMGSYQLCDFWSFDYFALAFDEIANVTIELENLLDSDIKPEDKIQILADISNRFDEFQSKDVYLTGKVLESVGKSTQINLTHLATAVSNLHKIEKTILQKSQMEAKATDLILENIDSIVKKQNLEDLVVTEYFVVFSTRISETNFSGLLLFEDEIRIVNGDFDIDEIYTYENLVSFIYLNPNLKQQIPDDGKIVINIFFKNCLFNEKKDRSESMSIIFGVLLPDFGGYSAPLSIYHNLSAADQAMDCSHWFYTKNNVDSFWKKDINGKILQNLIECDYWHTTHFALLLLPEDKYSEYDDILYWITTINSSVSLLGLSIIFLTAILFKKWRLNIGNQILLNFSFAIILQIVSFYIAGTINRHSDSDFFCTLIGVFLHYSTISEFFWTLVIAVFQFKRFVKVFASSSTQYLIWKTSFCGWVLPLLPVFFALIWNDGIYVNGKTGLCYPSGLALYLGVWLPIGCISIINFVIFLYIIYSVLHINVEQRIGHTGDSKHQCRLFISLFFMLGLTWTFGFLSELNFGLVFACLFCFTATLQGFIIFLYFIVLNSNTRKLYICLFKFLFTKKKI